MPYQENNMSGSISDYSAPKVSVIMPVYNTEMYVERAMISLMEQTLDDVQFIIINDGSKDNSLSIIKEVITRYPTRKDQITLISRENRGVAVSRAQGMELATGDYVIHLDSDDWAERNWLEAMYSKAIEDNADVVVCDYFLAYNYGNKKENQTKSIAYWDGMH
ncbi:glycosyltransferase family 2 protein [Vibrio mimicus]|nr:glycosyltransferase family 2 protein [Vibrio mimicus]